MHGHRKATAIGGMLQDVVGTLDAVNLVTDLFEDRDNLSAIDARYLASMTALCVFKTGGLCSCLAFSAVVGRSVPFLVVRVDG